MGGFESTSFWHRVFALVTFTCFGIYMVRLVRQFIAGHRRGVPWLRVVFGPDSPVPNWRDVKDFFKMLRWFVGLGPKPTFERWAYWEKFDFWGACADIVIIGSTGLVLWFPNFFCAFLPGVTLNVAKVIHSTQALLGHGIRLRDPLFQHSPAGGEVPRRHVVADRTGERRGVPARAAGLLRAAAARGQVGRTAGDRAFQVADAAGETGRLRRPGRGAGVAWRESSSPVLAAEVRSCVGYALA